MAWDVRVAADELTTHDGQERCFGTACLILRAPPLITEAFPSTSGGPVRVPCGFEHEC